MEFATGFFSTLSLGLFFIAVILTVHRRPSSTVEASTAQERRRVAFKMGSLTTDRAGLLRHSTEAEPVSCCQSPSIKDEDSDFDSALNRFRELAREE